VRSCHDQLPAQLLQQIGTLKEDLDNARLTWQVVAIPLRIMRVDCIQSLFIAILNPILKEAGLIAPAGQPGMRVLAVLTDSGRRALAGAEVTACAPVPAVVAGAAVVSS